MYDREVVQKTRYAKRRFDLADDLLPRDDMLISPAVAIVPFRGFDTTIPDKGAIVTSARR